MNANRRIDSTVVFVVVIVVCVFTNISSLILWYSSTGNIIPSQLADKPIPESPLKSGTLSSNKIPVTHRFADVCPPAGTIYAPSSDVRKVSLDQAVSFVKGGYNLMQMGSGDIRLPGLAAALLSKLQHERGIFGSVAELGVHHGRFTGCLFITAMTTEKLIVADVFDQQSKNLDSSGLGSRQHFVEGMKSYGMTESDVFLIYTGSTDELPFDWHRKSNFEQFRLISVDAGHTDALTFNDLEIAFCNLLVGGLVFLDDWFHGHWFGVTEGYFQFQSLGPTKSIFPIAWIAGKIVFTNDHDYHKLYYNKLNSLPMFVSHALWLTNKNQMNGVEFLRVADDYIISDEEVWNMWTEVLSG